MYYNVSTYYTFKFNRLSYSLIDSYIHCLYIIFNISIKEVYLLYFNYIITYIYYFFFFTFFFLKRFGIASLPTSISKFTVLRSPHVDKKSREQFELRVHKRVLRFPYIYSTFFTYMCFLSYHFFLCHYVHAYTNISEQY